MTRKGRPPMSLSRRERQIMEVAYRQGQVTVADVRGALPDPPSYSAVRAMLRVLEEKGHVRHEEEGARYVYRPTRRRENVRRTLLSQMVRDFFGGSAEQVVATLLDLSSGKLSQGELEGLARLIDEARKAGR